MKKRQRKKNEKIWWSNRPQAVKLRDHLQVDIFNFLKKSKTIPNNEDGIEELKLIIVDSYNDFFGNSPLNFEVKAHEIVTENIQNRVAPRLDITIKSPGVWISGVIKK